MKVRRLVLAVAIPVLGVAFYLHLRSAGPVTPTVLSFRIGQTFEEVVRSSTYPVVERSNIPTHAYSKSGETFVTEPSVILRFNDPRHGFTLPPTKFALVGYDGGKVTTATTSPMLESLPFDMAVAVLANLQKQFKAGSWQPWKGDDSTWFDLSPEGKKRLYERMFEPGYMQTASLRVPDKYGMTFRLKCARGCGAREPPYLFLIDVSVGQDVFGWEPGKPLH